jgi:excisionase family DNA binding protein
MPASARRPQRTKGSKGYTEGVRRCIQIFAGHATVAIVSAEVLGRVATEGNSDMQDRPQEILTTGEAAALCGVSRSTLRRAVAHGQLVAWHTPGKHLRFTRGACMDFARALGRVDLVGRPYADDGADQGEDPTEAPAGALEARSLARL